MNPMISYKSLFLSQSGIFLMLLPKNGSQKQNTELCEKVSAFFIYNLLHLNSLTMFQTSATFHSINEIKMFSLF
jgi:hypothetical protein